MGPSLLSQRTSLVRIDFVYLVWYLWCAMHACSKAWIQSLILPAADEQVVQRIEALEQDFLQHKQRVKSQLESMQASTATCLMLLCYFYIGGVHN